MKKTLLFSLLLMIWGAVAVAQVYKPGDRKTSFAAGDKVLIYNTTKVNGTQDRTGFLKAGTADKVTLEKQKPYTEGLLVPASTGMVWTVAAATESDGVYTLQITTVGGTYLGINGNPLNAEAQSLTLTPYASSSDKSGDDARAESVDGTTSAVPTAEDALWVVSDPTKTGNAKCWNGNTDSFTPWSTGHPYAFYAAIDVTESALATALTTLTSTISNVETQFTGLSTTTPIEFTLTTENLSGNAVVTTGSDGGAIPALLDGNVGTFFHSSYSGTNPGTYHHLKVDLGADITANAFQFGYTTRNSTINKDWPTRIRIWGSNNDADYEEITVLTTETDGLADAAAASYESKVIPTRKNYRYIRFDVEATRQDRKFGNFNFFTLSEFNFSPYSVTVAGDKSFAYVEKAREIIAAAKAVKDNADATYEELVVANSSLNNLAATLNVSFVISDASNPVYIMPFRPVEVPITTGRSITTTAER